MRPMASLDPPAANGTTNVIGRIGQVCAATDDIATSNVAMVVKVRIFDVPSCKNHLRNRLQISVNNSRYNVARIPDSAKVIEAAQPSGLNTKLARLLRYPLNGVLAERCILLADS